MPARWLPAVLATALVASLAGGLAAAPALAASNGTVDLVSDDTVRGAPYHFNGPAGVEVVNSSKLFAVHMADGALLLTYCINHGAPLNTGDTTAEVDWNSYELFRNDPSIGQKSLWIIDNSAPTVTADAFASTTGIAGITEKELITATQHAIWHFTSGSDVLPGSPADDSAVRIRAAHDWLVANANLSAQPTASLEVNLVGDATRAGELVGPFVVSTTATDVAVAGNPASTVLVNAAGDVVTTANNGDQIFIDATDLAAGSTVGVTASSSAAPVLAGRVFRTMDGAGQDLMVARATTTSSSAGRDVTLRDPRSIPSISTEVNKQQSLVGDVVKDTVVVSGLRPGATGTVTWKLLGPLPVSTVDPTTADWSTAAVAAEGTFDVTENGTYTTPDVTIATEGMYTYTETIVGVDADGTPFEFTSVPGLVEETTVAKTPCATDPSKPSDSPDCTEPTPEPTPVCTTNPDLPADSPECDTPCSTDPSKPANSPECAPPCSTDPSKPSDSPDCPAPCSYDPKVPANSPECTPCSTDPKLPAGSTDCPGTNAGGLAMTGSTVIPVSLGALLLIALGTTIVVRRKKAAAQN